MAAGNKLDPQFIKEVSSGMVTNINENILMKNSVALGLNIDFDEELGSGVTRPGTSIVNAQINAGKTVLGLSFYQNPTDSTKNKLLVSMNAANGLTQVIYDAATGSSSLAGDTKDLKTRFLTYLGSILRVNGTDAPKAFDGSSWVTTGGDFDLGNMPTGYKVAIEFLDRVYLFVNATNPDRFVYSGTPTGSPLAVSWTVDNGQVDLEPEDGGGGIVGAGKVPGYILIFKEKSMKRWNYYSASPETLINLGTPSHESIVCAAGICGFFSASYPDAIGFYITNGDRPVAISHLRAKNIKKWVDAIPSSYYASVSGWATETHMCWSVGDLTVDGVNYTKVVFRWSIKTGEWAVRSYPKEFRVFSEYKSGSPASYKMVGGTTDGEVIQLDVPGVYDDYPSNVPIQWNIMAQIDDFNFNQKKEISEKIIAVTKNAQGADVYVIVDDDNRPVTLGQIRNRVSEILFQKPLTGNVFQFGIRGLQKGSRAYFKEIELPNIEVSDNYV